MLHKILNTALANYWFPDTWKSAMICIIPKPNKTDYESPENYRPISILPALAKLFEKILLTRLRWQANSQSRFNANQYGFIEGKPTELAAHLYRRLKKVSETRRTQLVFFWTLKLPLTLLGIWPSSSRSSSCSAYIVKMIAAFLSDRTGVFEIDGTTLNLNIPTGCPQGSALSAFLWITLIEDVFKLLHSLEATKIVF